MVIWNVFLTDVSTDHIRQATTVGEECRGGQIAPALTCGVENCLYVFEEKENE